MTAEWQRYPLRSYALAVAAVVFWAANSVVGAAPTAPARPPGAPGITPAPPSSSPATPPSLPPLTAEEMAAKETGARAVLGDFFRAMFAGDEKAALGLLAYTDAKNQPMAETMLGEVLAEQRLRKAVTAAFGDKPFGVGLGAADIAAFEKDFAGAKATVNADGGGATVSMPLGISYVLMLKGGRWLVDFDKTQAGIGPLPRVEDLGSLTKMAESYEQLAADVAGKKFGSVEEVNKEVDKIVAAAKVKVAETRGAATGSGPATR